jgi:hypothetical protein
MVQLPREHGYLSGPGYSCCIWLMKEYGVIESWIKQCTIDLRDRGGLWETISFRNKRVLLLTVSRRKKLVLYDLKTNRFLNLGIRNEPFAYYEYICSKSSFTRSNECCERVLDFF